MRVVVADDVMLTRAGIVRLLVEAGVEVVGEADDLPSLMRQVALCRPDVVITDIRMPPTHRDEGLVAASSIRQSNPAIGVLILSQYVQSEYALMLMREYPNGVGYLLKERVFDIGSVHDALRRVSVGECVIDPTIVRQLLSRPREEDDALAALSLREREVLALVAEGHSNEGLASTLHIATRTVEAHVSEIFAKLGLPVDATANRRVLAVLTYLKSTR